MDVFIIGAGPAGSVAARLLSEWGWSVVVAHRPGDPRRSLAESLPSSARKLFDHVGVTAAIDAADFHLNFGNVVFWGGRSSVTSSDAAGVHVSRRIFDDVLRDSARAAGADMRNAVVRRVVPGDPIRVEYVTEQRREECFPRVLLDCSGRAGVVARREWRRYDGRYRTMAIAAEWESHAWNPQEQNHTVIESYRDGWAWSVPLSSTKRQVTVMIDADIQHRAHRAQREISNISSVSSVGSVLNVLYAREVAKTRELRNRISHARQTSTPWACDASLYDSLRAAAERILLVGDSASFIEPLSSAGVKKALASAWRAAVVANTCLSNPSMSGAALDLFDRREREVYTECRRRSDAFFSEAASVYDHPFWTARASGSRNGGELRAPQSDAALVATPEVRAAFDELRRAPTVRLRPATRLRVESAPTIEGREVVMRDAVLLPAVDAPLRFAAGVNLPALVNLTRHCDDIAALIPAYQATVGRVSVEELLTGVSLLVAHRALINEGSAS